MIVIFRTFCVALVLDLSAPNELWYTLENLLNVLRTQVDGAIAAARKDDPTIKDKLKQKLWERLGDDYPVSLH